jgi:hypothetical protein
LAAERCKRAGSTQQAGGRRRGNMDQEREGREGNAVGKGS